MNLSRPSRRRGFAIIMVMLVIVTLGLMAGNFAQHMSVEMKLARNSGFGSEMEWLGRSGVELARYVLGAQMNIPSEPYDSLNQKWAGGPLGTNEQLAAVSLVDNELGNGKFSIKIVDAERKYNINAAIVAALRGDPSVLEHTLTIQGVDAGEFSGVVGSLMDWVDPDDDTHIGGTESDYYLSLEVPYLAKNGLIDDVSELMLIRGITPEMYWGPAAAAMGVQSPVQRLSPGLRLMKREEPVAYTVGLADLFTAVSARLVNINTASADVLQLVPGLDQNIAAAIVQRRAGPDGQDGTEDDFPYRNVGELAGVVGMAPQAVQTLPQYFSVRSVTYEVTVTTTIDQRRAEWVAILRRESPKDVKILSFHRK
jgi:general secretion pathway protein K